MKNPQGHFTIDARYYALLYSIANTYGMSMSEYVSKLLTTVIKKEVLTLDLDLQVILGAELSNFQRTEGVKGHVKFYISPHLVEDVDTFRDFRNKLLSYQDGAMNIGQSFGNYSYAPYQYKTPQPHVLQSISQTVPQSMMSHNVPQNASQNISQSVPQSVPQSTSQGVTQSTSQSVTQSTSQSVTQSTSQSVTQNMSEYNHIPVSENFSEPQPFITSQSFQPTSTFNSPTEQVADTKKIGVTKKSRIGKI